jgi:hypothetical protein
VNLRTLRILLVFTLAFSVEICSAQKEVTYSLGVFGGLTSTFTFDEGISKDPRYQAKYGAHFIPAGIHAGIDFMGFGFMVDPQLTQIGQNFNILNTQGGQVGERRISATYLQLPFSYKKHIIDLSFFKVSCVLGLSYAQLLSAHETITHDASKLNFPDSTRKILMQPSYQNIGYNVVYDGVVSPEVAQLKTLQKSDFKAIQIFVSVGFRSDWDITDHARVSFDFRANGGVFDPRSSAYKERADNNQTIYEMGGDRRDFFASLTIGYSRYLFVEQRAKAKKVKPFQHYGPKRKIPK